jgi:hypothetical protein
MPPSLEIMMNHEERHCHSGLDMAGNSLTDEFDSPFPKVVVSPSTDDDNDETENSEGDENINCSDEAPTTVRMVNGEDWNHIVKPGLHDVLLGRGGGTNNHSGNIKFRKLVNEHKMRYLACSKVEKPKVARQVVLLWRKLDPPGRFLARRDETKRGAGSVKAGDNVWYEVGDKKAREKASQCLRERTPDVIPYIKHLREQQNAITEQGVSMVQMQMQQREQQQHVHLSPQRGTNNNGHMNIIQMASPSSGMHAHPSPGYNYSSFDGTMTSPQVRRNSLSMVPNSAPSNGHFSPSQQHHNAHQYQNHRRTSLPLMTSAPVVEYGFEQNQDDYHLINGDFAEMSEMEYQQQMMMMQQQMIQQQIQMQRMQQNRAMRAATQHGQQHSPHLAQYHSPTRNSRPQGIEMNGGPIPSMMMPPHEFEEPMNPQIAVPNGYGENVTPKNKRGRDEAKTAPDRTTSLMSLTPAGPDDHELSLEDYRQQLEEYIANSNKDELNQNYQDGNESDLEDDWEKERERAILQAQAHKKEIQGRGLSRNASGMSAMSGLLSAKSGMSLVSGFSGFSDLSKEKLNLHGKSEREQKMSTARSVGSNLSLMSELTDLSQNIDNLSIYDD